MYTDTHPYEAYKNSNIGPNGTLVGYVCVFSLAKGEMVHVSCSPSPLGSYGIEVN